MVVAIDHARHHRHATGIDRRDAVGTFKFTARRDRFDCPTFHEHRIWAVIEVAFGTVDQTSV